MIKIFISVLIVLVLAGCGANNNNKTAEGDKLKDSLTAALTAICKDSAQFKGFSVAIVNENGVLYQNGIGLAGSNGKKYTETTIQNIGSISKTLVGVSILKAQELGLLKLDDAINKYLPFKVSNPGFPQLEITLRHLVTHTSGITDNDVYMQKGYFIKPGQYTAKLLTRLDDEQTLAPADSAVTLPVFLENYFSPAGKWYRPDIFTKNKPGQIFEYTNTGTALAAYVLEKASGKNFSAFTKEHILAPLQMNASGWQFSEVDYNNYSALYLNPDTAIAHYWLATYPDGNFITSATDLAKFLQELIKGYNGHGTVLSAQSYKYLFTPQLTVANFTDRNEKNPYNDTYNYSIFMGFSVAGNIGHTGGDPGVSTIMFIDPKTKTGRLLIVNTNIINKAGGREFYAIWDKLGEYIERMDAPAAVQK